MQCSFTEYRKTREVIDFGKKVDTMCEVLLITGTSFKEFLHNVVAPVIYEQRYRNVDQLMKNWAERFAYVSDIHLVSEVDSDSAWNSKMPKHGLLSNAWHKVKRYFRPSGHIGGVPPRKLSIERGTGPLPTDPPPNVGGAALRTLRPDVTTMDSKAPSSPPPLPKTIKGNQQQDSYDRIQAALYDALEDVADEFNRDGDTNGVNVVRHFRSLLQRYMDHMAPMIRSGSMYHDGFSKDAQADRAKYKDYAKPNQKTQYKSVDGDYLGRDFDDYRDKMREPPPPLPRLPSELEDADTPNGFSKDALSQKASQEEERKKQAELDRGNFDNNVSKFRDARSKEGLVRGTPPLPRGNIGDMAKAARNKSVEDRLNREDQAKRNDRALKARQAMMDKYKRPMASDDKVNNFFKSDPQKPEFDYSGFQHG
jgi:hypothetical protein